MGILFACVALVAWGIGDFLIQRSVRKFGDLFTLFYITAFSAIVLLPFVLKDLPTLFLTQDGLSMLLLVSVVLLIAALLDFEALRVGKMSVVEPIYAFELPIAAMLAAIFLNERMNLLQYILIGVVVIGILLVSSKSHGHKRRRLERGVILAVLATIAMGAANFLFGFGARQTNPLLVNWFTSLFVAIICGAALVWQSRFHEIMRHLRTSKRFIFPVSFFDNLAWVTYATSMVFIPVGVATGISESYIVVASGLGVVFNRERLQRHQWVGCILCVSAVIALAFVT